MRLVNCHIENFGKLSDFNIEFNEHYNEFCYENGWGKSTLATFIKVMFFGFDGERKHKILENERKFYQPWQGGIYGGQLTFEIDGKQYIISRVFGKTEKDDRFELRDGIKNIVSNDYSENIGREIFDIDGDSFKRSVFISQSDCVTNATGDINAKMGNITDNTDDLTCFDAADGRIKDYLNKNAYNKKTGELSKLKTRKTELDNEVKSEIAIETIVNQLQRKVDEVDEEILSLDARKKEIGIKQKRISKQKGVQGKKEWYENLKNKVTDSNQKLVAAKRCFPGRIPDKKEIIEYNDLFQNANGIKNAADSYSLSNDEARQLEQMDKIFNGNIPKNEEFESIDCDNSELQKLLIEHEKKQLSDEERDNLRKYKEQFGKIDNVAKKIENLQDSLTNKISIKAEIVRKKGEIERIKNSNNSNTNENKKSGVLILGILLLVVGIAVSIKMTIPGILVALIGVICICVGFIIKGKVSGSGNVKESRSNVSGDKNLIEILLNEIEKDEELILSIDLSLKEFFEKINKTYDENLVRDDLKVLSREAVLYEELLRKAEKVGENESDKKILALSKNVEAFLNRYGVYCDVSQYTQKIAQLKNDGNEYLSLLDRNKKYNLKISEYNKKMKKVAAFVEDLNFVEENLKEGLSKVVKNHGEYENAKKNYVRDKEEIDKFARENDLEMLEKLPKPSKEDDLTKLNEDIDSINEEIEILKNTKNSYKEEQDDCTEKLDRITEYKRELEEVSEEYQNGFEKYKLVEKTRDFLKEAKENLTSEYIRPLKASFSNYYNLIAESDADKYNIDANSNITVYEAGMQRDLILFSAGYKDMISFCMRLAFIDAMYKEEKPMIILDDPFVNLDKRKLDAGKKLLKTISDKYQIIYFTCSESR